MNMSFEELPPYVYSDCCDYRHFLTLSRDIKNDWCIGYVAHAGCFAAIGDLAFNHCKTIADAAAVMTEALEIRKNRRNLNGPIQ